MIKSILWDLDGVLIESEQIVYERWAQTYKDLGFALPQEVYFKNIGQRPDVVYNLINKELHVYPGSADEFFRTHRERRGENPEIPLVPHIEEVLAQLHPVYEMAVVTSSEMNWLKKMLKENTKYFKAFVTSADIEHPKPHPQPYLAATEKLHVTPGESVVIEDSAWGVESGKKAGTLVIARQVEYNKAHDMSQADYIISDVREIPRIIDGINIKS